MSQAYVLYLAVFVSFAALMLTGWKIWADRDLRNELLSFQRSERSVRENNERNETRKREAFELGVNSVLAEDKELARTQWEQFESSEREKRETFEAAERTLRVRFMAGQDRALTEAEARIKHEIESYVKLEKWREETWQRNLTRLEQASKDLTGTTAGLISLIDEGPFFDDARMIQETARVLDVFGDFQSSVCHFAMPAEMSELSKELVGQVTKILLTLSPYEQVRKSDERKALLAPLRMEMKAMSAKFLSKCGDFERDPSAFFIEREPSKERQRPRASNSAYLSPADSPIAK